LVMHVSTLAGSFSAQVSPGHANIE
jgi:hypothetical protein